jgi:hypothetical protein
MAGARAIQCIGPSYRLADRKSGIERSVNLFMRQVEGVGEDLRVVLDSPPGLVEVHDLGDDVRGWAEAEGRWFVVAGFKLYEIEASGTVTERGSLASVYGYVGMKPGSQQLVLVDGAHGYVFDLQGNDFAQITSGGWRGSADVDELDGYFIFVAPDSDQFYISAIDDGSTLDALDFSSADAAPDLIRRHIVYRRELFIFGAHSCEVWIDSGDADFPFVRYNSTPIDVGIVGPRAIALASDCPVWIGQTTRGRGYVYQMQGHQPLRISTQAIEEVLEGSSDISQAVMWSYMTDGNEFVGITAPGLDTALVYDFSTQQWHERAELDGTDMVPMRGESVLFHDGAHYVYRGSKIYRLDKTTAAIDGAPMLRERTWPHLVTPTMELMPYRSLDLACSTGQGDASISLEISNDGGYNFDAPLIRSLGAVGRWMQRVRWLFLGQSRDRVFRLRCHSTAKLTIHSANVEAG